MVHHWPKEFLIWYCTDGAVNYDYIVTNNINSGSRTHIRLQICK